MAFVIADRVRETTTSIGTGAVTLAGPFTGFQSFSAAIGDTNSTYYALADAGSGDWEVGIGTYSSSGNTLSRTTILASSNSGSAVVFGAGTKDVICTQPAERNVYVVGSSVVAANNATVPNALLANSSLTLGSTNVALGATATTLAGLTSVSATNFAGALDGVVGGVTPAAGTFTTAAATTGNITTVNSTTVDTTNIEVTSLKAKDGTAAGSIADSTGVVTLGSSVLTTTDINGGTIDGTTIGASSAAAATVTVLTASQDSSFTSTGAVTISVGTTAQRPTGAVGKIRWNSSLNQYEGYDGTNWTLLGGAVITNDTSTATNLYPTFAGVTSGNVSTLFTGNAKLLYKPSTGELQSSALVASNGIVVNSKTVSSNYTIATGNNASSAGPVTVADGVSVTVSDGSRWVVV